MFSRCQVDKELIKRIWRPREHPSRFTKFYVTQFPFNQTFLNLENIDNCRLILKI